MALTDHLIDGSLGTWQEVEGECEWSSLLLGNGLSRNVSGDFAYPSLFGQARRGNVNGGLTKADRVLFDTLQTKNFERVLADLATSIRIAETLAQDAQPYLDRYQSIQRALGHAVRSVHVSQASIPGETLKATRAVWGPDRRR